MIEALTPRRVRALGRTLLLGLTALALVVVLAACAAKKTSAPNMSAKGLDTAAAVDYYFLLFQDLQQQGNTAQALEVLEELVKLAPSPQMHKDLANLYWGQSKTDKARATLEAGLAKYPEDKGLHFYLANSYLLERRFDDAAKVLTDYLARHPKDQSTSQELAAVYVESGKFQPTLDFLASIPKDKRTPAMAFYEAKAYSGLKKPKQAIEKLHQALREDPKLLPAWSELAFVYEKQKDYRQAEDAYVHILELGEDGPEVWLRLIRLTLKSKRPAKAVEYLDQGPKDRGFLFEALALFLEEGYPDASNAVVNRLAKEQPDNPDVLFVRAMLAVENEKDIDKGLALLAQIPPGSKLYDKSFTTRVQLALDNNRLDLAKELIDQGKTKFADHLEFWFYESIYYEKKDDQQRALEVLRQALTRWPDNTELLYRLGAAYERVKMRVEALALMEKILTIDPANADALNFVGYSLAEEGRDLDRSLELINKALAAAPENPYFIDSLAWVLFKRGDTAGAWKAIQRSVTKAVGDPAIWEHYGDIAVAQGDKREAAKGYKQALGMNPANADEIKRKLEAVQ